MRRMISGLDSARLKLIRAAEHIDSVVNSIGAYSGSEPHEITMNADGKETVHVQILPPPEISVTVGETIYQIRSALDHLAFDLVKLNTRKITLPDDWSEHCLFPLKLCIPTACNGNTPVPYKYFEKALPGISIHAFEFIESLQPYYR